MNSDTIRDGLRRNGGVQVTLRRPGTPNVDVVCWAKVTGSQPVPMPDGVVQATRNVILSNSEIRDANWPGPPRKGDKVIIDGTPETVLAPADSATVNGETVRHVLKIRGSDVN